MRLPIYRRLDEGLKIFGLSLKEVAILGVIFVGFGQFLSFWKWGRLIALALTLFAFVVIRLINQHLESFYLEKLVRFSSLPKGMHRGFFKNVSLEGAKSVSKTEN